MQLDAELVEKRRRLRGGKRSQHTANDARGSSPEILFRNDTIGDIAAGTTAHENLGPDAPRAVETDHPKMGRLSLTEDGGCQPCGAATHDDDVRRTDHVALSCQMPA